MDYINDIQLSGIERQVEIQKWVEKENRITVQQICESFKVSEATARRDLESLSEAGKVQRVHGGAIRVHLAPPEKPFMERTVAQLDEKQRIGRLAADLIEDGESVFLGSGTTVYEIAKNLHSKNNLTIITNSLLVIEELNQDEDITIISTGGILRKSEQSFIGHITEQTLRELRVDKVVAGIRAISLDQGLTNDYLPETMTDRAIMGMGSQLIIVADHSKCDRVSTVFVAPLKKVDILVTTREAPGSFLQAVRDFGITVMLA